MGFCAGAKFPFLGVFAGKALLSLDLYTKPQNLKLKP